MFWLGIVGTGCRVVGGHPGHTVFEIREMLSACNVKLIITEPQLLTKVRKSVAGCEVKPQIYCYGGLDSPDEGDIGDWRELVRHGEKDWQTLPVEQAKEDIAAYCATSGTTGTPKYAAISHSYFVREGMHREAQAAKRPYPISRLVSLPLMHTFATPIVIVASFRCGTPTYVMRRFAAEAFISTISNFSITEIPVVPPMLSA